MSTHPSIVLRAREPSQSEVWVNLLGGPYLMIGGERVEIPEGSKRLLAYVALSGGRVERRRTAGALWPENDELRSAGNLRSALWRLNALGCDVVAADKVALWLCPGASTDVEIMNGWAERLICGRPNHADLCPLAWRADFVELLPGWCDDWALFERERIRQLLLHAMEALAAHLVAAQRYAEAVIIAMTAVSTEPLRESAHRVLIETHLAEGNVMEARRAYEAYRALVESELGVAPGPSLSHLPEAWSSTSAMPWPTAGAGSKR
jgi:DNA-binding SARP family transcriptional activator